VRQQDEQRKKQAIAIDVPMSTTPTPASDGVESNVGAEGDEVAAPETAQERPPVFNALCDAFGDEEDAEEEGVDVAPAMPLDAHGPDLSKALRSLRRKLKEYLAEQSKGNTVAVLRLASGAEYPTMQWTIQFGKWMASHRTLESKANKWNEKAWRDEYEVRKTLGKDSFYVALQHMKNHLWREVWPAMPVGADARQYWHCVTKQTMAMFDGGGGDMLAAASLVEKKAMEQARRAGKCEAEVAATGLEARKETMGMLRAATSKPCTREHLYQVGEYQLQDAFLSDPFAVNASYVMNAHTCSARTTGCRPGMAVNDAKDSDDPAGHWYELPPLQMGSLAISPESLRQMVASVSDQDVQKLLRMEISFERKKGEYFACYDFGTAITPDSEMIRIGTLAMIRLQLATASFRACYQPLQFGVTTGRSTAHLRRRSPRGPSNTHQGHGSANLHDTHDPWSAS